MIRMKHNKSNENISVNGKVQRVFGEKPGNAFPCHYAITILNGRHAIQTCPNMEYHK